MARKLMKVLLGVVVTAAVLVMAPVQAFASTQQSAGRDQLSGLDRTFMMQAAQSGLFEIKKSELALRRSSDERVRDFAQQMIRDHGQQSAELAALAARKGVALPQEPSELQQLLLGQLVQSPAERFDCAYMSVQVVAHLQTIALFKTEASFGSSPQVKAFAVRWLPALTMHLREAVELRHALGC